MPRKVDTYTFQGEVLRSLLHRRVYIRMGSYVRACPRPGTHAILAVATTGAMSMSFERAGVCTLDCPDTCSLTVTVDADRVVKVRGSDALPYTEGVICNKVARHRRHRALGA